MPRVAPKPYWQTTDGQTVRLYQGDVIDILRRLPSSSIHCVVTSPPYWQQRRYLFKNAVTLRDDLTPDELTFVLGEMEKHGIRPKS